MKAITAYQSFDGTVHVTPEAAARHEAAAEARQMAEDLAELIRPAYSNRDEIASALLERGQLVIDLAAALKRAQP